MANHKKGKNEKKNTRREPLTNLTLQTIPDPLATIFGRPQISGFYVERIHWHEITVWLWEFNYTPELGTAFLSQHQ